MPAMLDVPKQRYQGVDKQSSGYKLLAAMGWKEGEGLGALKQGIKEHIKVKKKFDSWGVGAVEAAERARDWSVGMVEYHRVLSTLSEITSQHASQKLESEASEGECKQKKDIKKRKKARKDKERKCLTEGEANKEGEPNAKRLKSATHLGRFKRRETAKMVQNYSANDLAAILGLSADPFAAACAAQCEKPIERPRSPTPDDKGTEAVTESTIMHVEEIDQTGIEHWWHGYFTRAASRIGAAMQKAGKITVHGFSEQDQTSLFNLAHENKTQGKVGLGRGSMPNKIAGARWEGKRTKLDSEEEEDTEMAHEEESRGIVVVMPPSHRLAAIDWIALAKETLVKAGKKKMKLKKMMKKIIEVEGLDETIPEGQVMEQLKSVLQSCSTLRIDGRSVTST